MKEKIGLECIIEYTAWPKKKKKKCFDSNQHIFLLRSGVALFGQV